MAGRDIKTPGDKVVKITAGIERRTAEHAKSRKGTENPRPAGETVCESGVCMVTWKPQRPAA